MADGPLVEIDTIADTLVVRTVSGSVWGGPARLVPDMAMGEFDGDLEYIFGSVGGLAVAADGTIYVLDRQVPELRAYDRDGTYLRTLGTPGEGPGELKQPDGALAVLSDGRVLVRDPGNARIQVFSADGEPAETWPIRGGFFTSTPFYQTPADEVHAIVLLDPEADIEDWQTGLVRFGPDGQPGDTLVPPDAAYEAPFIEARVENSVARNGVPFTARESWVLHPDGYFVHGVATAYRFTLLKPGTPLRVERSYDPVAVTSGERSEEERSATANMRRMLPSWRWNGPAIPDEKPPYRDLLVGRDGRIWVLVSSAGVRVEDPSYDPTDPESIPDEWREPVAFDVFEPDGRYLGRVETETGFSRYPTPVFDGDYVWAVREDELGVQQVVRYWLVTPDSERGLSPETEP